MNIVVYLGSSEGKKPIYKEAVIALGKRIGKSGNTLVYGGSKAGLMGYLAEAVMSEKGEVIGVEPEFFIKDGVQQLNLTELIVTDTMSERKQKMMDLGDAFIAFPGGIGTLEEITEVTTLLFLGKLSKPVIVYNLDGFYDIFKEQFEHMAEEGFVQRKDIEKLHFVESLDDIAEILNI